MESPALIGISEYKPLPLWRLILALVLLLGVAAFYGFLIHQAPPTIPWMGGFVVFHWLVPGLLALAGGTWAIRRSRDADRRRGAMWGVLGLLFLQILGIGGWWKMRQVHRNLDGFYDSRVEYVRLSTRSADWPDPAQPQVFDLGSGLRLAMSTAIWTDGLHRSLPRSTAPEPEPYPESGDPRPLSDLGQRNLEVLMKACALIRFFHPADEAQSDDWGRLISQGVRAVEDAPNPADLAQRLQRLLGPLAPQARFLLPGEPVPSIKAPEGAVYLARWRHLGAGFECLRMPFTGSTKDRSARLAGVGMAWATLEHFFPYWDVTPGDWKATLHPALEEAALAASNDEYVETLLHMLNKARDGHAWAYDLSAQNPGRPDARLELVEGRPIVTERWGTAPGLPLGGEVLTVDGTPVDTRLAKLRPKLSGSTPGYTDVLLASWLLKAPPNQSLKVEVRNLNGQISEHHLITSLQSFQTRPLPEAIREPKPGVFIVDLSRVDEDAFGHMLSKFATARGLIFDLRGYPIQRAFLAHFRPGTHSGVRMFRPLSLQPEGVGRTYVENTDKTNSEGPYYQGRVVVLAGPATGSFGETCLEIVAANHLAPIVGSASAGTNGDFLAFWLPGNVNCRFTGMKVLHADGSPFQGTGVQPTHPVKHTRAALAAGRDEDVERALALIETGS